MDQRFPGAALVVDDHPLYCSALSSALTHLNPDARIDVASSAEEARLLLSRDTVYDLVMIDFMLPGSLGLSLLTDARAIQPNARIVVISGREEEGVVQSALRMGADGFIGKSLAMADVIEKVHAIATGRPDASVGPEPEYKTAKQSPLADLSPAQMRILVAMADGRLNKQIAFDLGLAEPTVKSHLSAIFRKLGVNNRTQAVLVAQSLLPAGPAATQPVEPPMRTARVR